MKSYTDIEQSKKLAEILPLESADMYYFTIIRDYPYSQGKIKTIAKIMDGSFSSDYDTPCWSLAALLQVLPNEISTGEEWHNKYQIDIRKYNGGDNTTLYQIAYGNNRGSSGSWHDMINTGERQNLIDCCVDMILLCKEHNWL